MPTLRPYQAAAVDECAAKIEQSPILVAPTGSGKTVMGVALAQRVADRVLFVAHRVELIRQIQRAARDAGCDAGVIMAGERADPSAPVQVASIQTLANRELPDADLVVVDECHHSTAPSYKRVLGHYRLRAGLTATPFRLDGRGLGSCGYGEIVVAAYTDELVESGVLHAPRTFAGRGPDLSSTRIRGGEFALDEVASKMENAKLTGDIVENWMRRAFGMRSVAFAVGVEHGLSIARRFREAGVVAEVVTGATPQRERDATLERLAIGTTSVVVNCMVLTEGWDLPSLEAAIMARPTASLNLYLQIIGRVMRACDGKDGAVVLDHAGNYFRHGLVTDRLVYSLHDPIRKKSLATSKACPECEYVNKRTAKVCVECGHAFGAGGEDERDLCPAESPHLLREVTVFPGSEDSFDERQRRWVGWLRKASRIASFRQAADAGGLVFALNDSSQNRAAEIAITDYRKRYGVRPVFIGERLFDPKAPPGAPGCISTVDRALLEIEWTKAGQRAGWTASKVQWFVRQRVAEIGG